MLIREKVVDSDRIWACLLTNDAYLPGLLTLAFSLHRVRSKYPLVALYTDSLSADALRQLRERHIPTQRVGELRPSLVSKLPNCDLNPDASSEPATSLTTSTLSNNKPSTLTDSEAATLRNCDKEDDNPYPHNPRFLPAFTKLRAFALVSYARVALLDADMLVRRNMDELLELHDGGMVFGAAHACLCNPLRVEGYPAEWKRENCAYTAGGNGRNKEKLGASCLNGGLIVFAPGSGAAWEEIDAFLRSGQATAARLPFADQSLLGDVFRGRWMALPWVYNGLKTLRWEGVHADMWSDDEVKNVHYILTPKPWELQPDKDTLDEPERWWWEVDSGRRQWEATRGLDWNVSY